MKRSDKKKTNKLSSITIEANNNTLKCEMICNLKVDFTKSNTIRELLGFKEQVYEANIYHISEKLVNIIKVIAICIECNIVTGSYDNSKQVHRIHEFFPNVPSGFKIIENPLNVIYLPINTNIIDTITLKLVDQNGELVNFREEFITVIQHLKKI